MLNMLLGAAGVKNPGDLQAQAPRSCFEPLCDFFATRTGVGDILLWTTIIICAKTERNSMTKKMK